MNLLELLKVDAQDTLNFFYSHLREKTVPRKAISDAETMYVASVLASYARTSPYDTDFFPPLSNLSEVFDTFVIGCNRLQDPQILELAGSQIILLAGFFRGQMSGRHNIGWYDSLGSTFYYRASTCSGRSSELMLFRKVSKNFPSITAACSEMSRDLSQNYLLYQN